MKNEVKVGQLVKAKIQVTDDGKTACEAGDLGMVVFIEDGNPTVLFHDNDRATVMSPEEYEVINLHPSVQHLLGFFRYDHLPPMLASTSKQFAVLAINMAASLPGNPETTVALRKLLEAKDCAVRSVVLG